MVSLSQLQDIPPRNMILLVGPPGSGKTTFCQQTILQNAAMDRPIIYVTTEYGPSEAEKALKEQGLAEVEPGLVNYVDAYNETVGLSVSDRPHTALADCEDLSSIGIAISKLQERIGKKAVLLVFDSLTSPYLFNGSEILKFMRRTLSRFASRGNRVLTCFDEGSSKEEDLVAMMSLSNGVIKMIAEKSKMILDVVKHPRMKPTEIEVPLAIPPRVISCLFDRDYLRREAEMFVKGTRAHDLRPGIGDFIGIAWRDLAVWSGGLWDPKGFPTMMYELTKYSEDVSNYDFDFFSIVPWHMRLILRRLIPKNFSKVEDMKKMVRSLGPRLPQGGIATLEYLEETSKMNEHYLRVHESYECWGLENIGTSLGFMRPALIAGLLMGFENWKGLDRDWNAVETKCIGLGDPYCEWKMVPGEIDELKDSLEKNSSVIEKIHERLMDHILGFLIHEKPLLERPNMGSNVHIHEVQHVMAAPTANERLQMVFRMGGTKTGKILGERLLQAGFDEEKSVRKMIDLMEHCKVGKITLGETMRMRENCERFGIRTEEPSCYFTTGFLNGFFYAVKNQHVKETRCIAIGDPYCEWEFT